MHDDVQYQIFPALFFLLSDAVSDGAWLNVAQVEMAERDSKPWSCALSCSSRVLYWNTRVSFVDRLTSF